MNIAQKIMEAHKLKFGSLPPLQQCSVSGSALFNADCMDILPLIPDDFIFEIEVEKEVPKDELMKRSYPYPIDS